MRMFLIGLLALNLIYFFWQSSSQKEEVSDRPALTRGVKNVPLLVRLNEVNDPPSPASPVPMETTLPDDPEMPVIPAAMPGRYCYTLGPFTDKEKMEKTKRQLAASGISADVRENKERKQRGYWVYLPSYQSREEALAVSRELAANGLKDYFIINDDKHKHAISLGLFSKKAGSQRRMQKIKAIGFEPKIEVRYREQTVYWLDYETVEEKNSIIGITDTRDQDIEQLTRNCT
ncbi:MAG TPA: SPOR domain-containing protein [Chromatiales bacterium]|nr:SPOR domain-containing protein [Thiotrichales bacterium]HIP68654.1 SPOR domain-containing protein [Chromatiales bacterium]